MARMAQVQRMKLLQLADGELEQKLLALQDAQAEQLEHLQCICSRTKPCPSAGAGNGLARQFKQTQIRQTETRIRRDIDSSKCAWTHTQVFVRTRPCRIK